MVVVVEEEIEGNDDDQLLSRSSGLVGRNRDGLIPRESKIILIFFSNHHQLCLSGS